MITPIIDFIKWLIDNNVKKNIMFGVVCIIMLWLTFGYYQKMVKTELLNKGIQNLTTQM